MNKTYSIGSFLGAKRTPGLFWPNAGRLSHHTTTSKKSPLQAFINHLKSTRHLVGTECVLKEAERTKTVLNQVSLAIPKPISAQTTSAYGQFHRRGLPFCPTYMR